MVPEKLSREAIDECLRHTGLRSTIARRAILAAMNNVGPLREEEIASRVGQDCPDPATVYRTLSTLVEVGLVRRHRFREPVWYFSLQLPGKGECTHAHFVCENCGICECLEDSNFPEVKIDPEGRQITGVEIVVNGICRNCRDTGSNKRS